MHPFNLHIHGDRPTVYMMYMYIQSLVMHLLISTQCSGFMLNVFWYVFAILQLYTAYVYIYTYMGNYNDLIAISLKWLVREIITKYPRIIVIHPYIYVYIYTYTYIHIYIHVYALMISWPAVTQMFLYTETAPYYNMSYANLCCIDYSPFNPVDPPEVSATSGTT